MKFSLVRSAPPGEPAPLVPGALGVRLTRLALAVAAVALLVTGTALNVAMHLLARDGLVDETTIQARMLAANLEAPIVFSDPRAAGEVLASLDRSPGVARATVFDAQNRPLASYWRAEVHDEREAGRVHPDADADAQPSTERNDLAPSIRLPASAPAASPVDGVGHRYVGDMLVVTERIEQARREIGRVRLEVPLAPLHARAWLFGSITVGAALCAMLLAYLLAVGVRRDVDVIERRLDDLAHLDPVTGLFNRHAAREHLAVYVDEARASGEGFTVATLDLDNFKAVNDTLGHHVGDELLRLVAQRLRQVMPPGARAYRFGGDEFVVIVPGKAEGQAEVHPARIVRQALTGTVRVEGIEMRLGGSIGIARFPVDGAGADEVLLASDMAMYQAKAAGKNQVAVFHHGLREANEQQLRTESDLRSALRHGQLRLYYQPIVELASGNFVGAEALLRWEHPQRGLQPPAPLISVAERSGLIVQLGGWVLQEAARQQVVWRSSGLPPWPVAVNVSARQLRGGRLLQQLDQALMRTGCRPDCLEIELTEHTLVEDVDDNIRLLARLRERGVRIAIDDFGTGLSSLAYLKRLPAAKLKIDRSFVRDLPTGRGDAAIVQAAVSMAHALGLDVVAEGVETAAQHRVLADMGCRYGQGYLYSPPLDAEAFARWVQARLPAARTGPMKVPPPGSVSKADA
jgi:diguanylate cyclase (GGDEF)-like protein